MIHSNERFGTTKAGHISSPAAHKWSCAWVVFTFRYVTLPPIAVGHPSLQTDERKRVMWQCTNSVNPWRSEQRFPVFWGLFMVFFSVAAFPVKVISHQMTWAVSCTRNHVLPAADRLLCSSDTAQRHFPTFLLSTYLQPQPCLSITFVHTPYVLSM
jgi:hypothetical protein